MCYNGTGVFLKQNLVAFYTLKGCQSLTVNSVYMHRGDNNPFPVQAVQHTVSPEKGRAVLYTAKVIRWTWPLQDAVDYILLQL